MSNESVLTDLEIERVLGFRMALGNIGFVVTRAQIQRVAQEQAKVTAAQKDRVLDATIKSVLGHTPKHCARHPHFVDECVSCQNIVNENVDWQLHERLQSLLNLAGVNIVK